MLHCFAHFDSKHSVVLPRWRWQLFPVRQFWNKGMLDFHLSAGQQHRVQTNTNRGRIKWWGEVWVMVVGGCGLLSRHVVMVLQICWCRKLGISVALTTVTCSCCSCFTKHLWTQIKKLVVKYQDYTVQFGFCTFWPETLRCIPNSLQCTCSI